MIKSTWRRAALKSAVWKIIGVVSLIAVSWAAGIDPIQIGKITIAYHIITLILYVIHERVWSNVSWGYLPRKGKNGINHN